MGRKIDKAKDLIKDAKKVYKKFSPIKNEIEIGDSSLKLKWKLKPHWKKEKLKATIEINKSIDNVDLFAVINGTPYLMGKEGIGVHGDTEEGNDIFSVKIGATTKF